LAVIAIERWLQEDGEIPLIAEKCALPASDRRLDGLAFIIPFLARSFCFDFPLSGRDICGYMSYMIFGARGFSVLCFFIL